MENKYKLDLIIKGEKCMEKYKLPISEKMTLTVEETAAYSNLEIPKIRSMEDNPSCSFAVYVGRR